ncbi:MAG: glycoside hydrolase family 3 C-terminal domain-containing protein [Planctomycetota bacterium]
MSGTPHVDTEQRVAALLEQMTTDEKIAMLCGDGMWFLRGVERLGVPSIRMTDCGHGVTATDQEHTCATCFPTAVGQASTWNTDLLETMGAAMGCEVRASGNSILLGPMVNIHRMPLNGRHYECYSEDPHLAGTMAAALVRGIQSENVGACVKGCTANNQQADQNELDVRMDERTLREIYLPNFRIPVAEARPWAIMTCYNGLNGDHSSSNHHLLTEIVKETWGFDGFIVSDWRGTHNRDVLTSGLDLEMPGPGKWMRPVDIQAALSEGLWSKADLDDHVRRLLRAIVKTGRMDRTIDPDPDQLGDPAHAEVARQVATEAIVLLKNDDALLPLDLSTVKRILVTGPNAEQARLGGGGSASVSPFDAVSPLAGLRKRSGEDVHILYEEGWSHLGERSVITDAYLTDAHGSAGLDAAFFNNQALDGEPIHTTTHEQIDFSWGWAAPGDRVRRNQWSARWTGRLVPPVTGRYTLGVLCTDGGFRLYIDDDLVLSRWGQGLGEHKDVSRGTDYEGDVEVDLEAGNPVAVRLEFYKIANKSALRLEWDVPGRPDRIERAVAAARDADVAVVCAGLSNRHEGGTNDRTDLDLPGRQVELIREVAKANPNTVVVLANGTPINVTPWIDDAKAVLETWYGGQEVGTALASLLAGDESPSGKLPTTFPARLEDNPAWGHYPGDGTSVTYAEGIFVGYRHYDTRDIHPAFPFGFGLSYTTFAYDTLRLSSETMTAGDTIEVAVDVTNTGDRPGKEIVQVYVRDVEASVPRPVRELKGFAKVALAPGETATVTLPLTAMDLSFFDDAANAWTAEAGDFDIQVGPHSRAGLTARLTYAG